MLLASWIWTFAWFSAQILSFFLFQKELISKSTIDVSFLGIYEVNSLFNTYLGLIIIIF
jgi:hypothetical protein